MLSTAFCAAISKNFFGKLIFLISLFKATAFSMGVQVSQFVSLQFAQVGLNLCLKGGIYVY